MDLARNVALPVYGLYHASHLPLPDLDAIVCQSYLLDRPSRSHGSLLRPKWQSSARIPSLREVLLRSVGDILQEPLDLEDDAQKIVSLTQGRDVHLTSIGPARISHLERALNPTAICRFGSRNLQSRNSVRGSADYEDSIAVVGMAGRFPDAQNVDELWKILIENRDLHQLVSV